MYTDSQRRTHIYDLQRFLRRIQQEQGAVQPLAPDGIFGPETAAAVREFQRRGRLPVTGTANFDTWTAIYAAYLALTDLPRPVCAKRRGYFSSRRPEKPTGPPGRRSRCSTTAFSAAPRWRGRWNNNKKDARRRPFFV